MSLNEPKITKARLDRAFRLVRSMGISARRDRAAEFSKSQCWFLVNQHVTIGTKGNPRWAVLASLAHEVGHCLSCRGKPACNVATYMLHVWHAPLTKPQALSVIREERRAWRLGFSFLKKHGLPVTKQMRARGRRLLQTHIDGRAKELNRGR